MSSLKTCPVDRCNNRCDISARMCVSCYKTSRKTAPALPVLPTTGAATAAPVQPAPVPVPVETVVVEDREKCRLKQELSAVKDRYKVALQTVERQERELRIVNELQDDSRGSSLVLEPSTPSGTGEATAVLVASDWHIEERVGREVGGLNEFTIEIARERVTRFFQKGLRLIQLLSHDIQIPTIVLALLGDFISNDIHEEFAEHSELLPMHAIIEAQDLITAGIRFLLAQTSCNIVIPCHSGNHARTTLKTRSATENGHSLEFLMYMSLRAIFANEPRVQFVIPEGPHSYLQVYNTTIRFQHGHHGMRYGGGVGGIYIPVNKAIAEFNKARHADLDVFGHFHQARDGGNFICNGSLIGYNAFALSNHFSFEEPKQQLFLIDKKRGRTCLWPVLVGRRS